MPPYLNFQLQNDILTFALSYVHTSGIPFRPKRPPKLSEVYRDRAKEGWRLYPVLLSGLSVSNSFPNQKFNIQNQTSARKRA